MKVPKWQDQWERVQRLQERVIQRDSRNPPDVEDDLWSFFVVCFHLKDWVKNDPQVPQGVQDRVEKDFDAVRSLTIVADLANRSKHFELTRRIRHDAKLGGRKTLLEVTETITVGEGHPDVQVFPVKATHDWSIELGDGLKPVWALDLAQQAVHDWSRLLKAWNLVS